MSIYGSTKGVASYTPMYADNVGDAVDFTSRTKPTNTQLQRWMEHISSDFDTALRTFGFQAPVDLEYEDAHNVITMKVETYAATLVEGVNAYQRAAATKYTGWSLVKELANIREDIMKWVEDNSAGLEDGGLPRPVSDLATILTKETEGVETIFRRNQYNGTDTAQ